MDYYLADSLEISEDGKTYKIHIRDDANWSDGTPITTADIKFCADYSIHKYGYNRYIRVNGVEGSMNIIDDKTIEFVLPEAYNYEVVTLSGMNVSRHTSSTGIRLLSKLQPNTTARPALLPPVLMLSAEINDDSFVCTARDRLLTEALRKSKRSL